MMLHTDLVDILVYVYVVQKALENRKKVSLILSVVEKRNSVLRIFLDFLHKFTCPNFRCLKDISI